MLLLPREIKDDNKLLPPDKNLPLLFVYGTLKRGHANHRRIEEAEFVCRLNLTPDFYMISFGGFPGIVYRNDFPENLRPTSPKLQPTQITGELYRVTKEMLASVDLLEGHPTFYKRRVLDVSTVGEQAYFYVLPTSYVVNGARNRDMVDNGIWKPTAEELEWAKKTRGDMQ
jgi:gamma-glutamylaminecyclotransferase